MYRILIVDDEEIEREGMAQFIDWTVFGAELAGTAWNGVEALEKIEKELPDIVLTDIKMPVMDGITLIQKTQELFPDIQFIVLSGYGEYEFTSRAMELGVRYYLLKPCDEEQIRGVMDKVIGEIEKRKEQEQRERSYQETVERLLPQVKKQILREMLLAPYHVDVPESLLEGRAGSFARVMLLGFRTERGFDYLEQFIMSNILLELLGEKQILLSATIGTALYYLLASESTADIAEAARRALSELKRVKPDPIYHAVSSEGSLDELKDMYEELQELIKIGRAEQRTELLTYENLRDGRKSTQELVDYDRLKETDDFAVILSEITLFFMKMQHDGLDFAQKEEMAGLVLKIICGEIFIPDYKSGSEEQHEWEMAEQSAYMIAGHKNILANGSKEEQWIRDILCSVFRYIQKQTLNIRYLAKEVLFMSEDYLSRMFAKSRKQKFSAFLLEQRVRLAEKMMEYDPELKIGEIAEMVGYSPDGQYFSKAFKKTAGLSPTEYREKLRDKSEEKTG